MALGRKKRTDAFGRLKEEVRPRTHIRQYFVPKREWRSFHSICLWLFSFILSWIALEIISSSDMPLSGFMILLFAFVMTPPMYEWTHDGHEKTVKAVLVIALFTLPFIDISQLDKRKQEQNAVKWQQAEERRLEKVEQFAPVRDETIAKLKAHIQAEEYQEARALAKPYLDLRDEEITALHNEADAVIRKAAQQERLKQDAINYIDMLENQIADMKSYDLAPFLKDKDSIIIGAAMYGGLAMQLDEAKKYDLSPEQKQVVERFKRQLIDRQKADLPRLRDAYGPIVRKALWAEDLTAKTFGRGYTTIEFAGGMFAANRNIATFQAGVAETLKSLRFKQVRYKWYKEDDEYQYYKLETPSDGTIAVYERGGFRKID